MTVKYIIAAFFFYQGAGNALLPAIGLPFTHKLCRMKYLSLRIEHSMENVDRCRVRQAA